jgi:hypothetical protein
MVRSDNTKSILRKYWKSILVFIDGLHPTSYIYVLADISNYNQLEDKTSISDSFHTFYSV